jgi:hypothetical protein
MVELVRKKGCRSLAVVLLAAIFAGCVGYRQALEDCYVSAGAGDFRQALASLESSSLAHSGKNRLLYLMEKGLLLHLQGNYRESIHALEEADRLTEELFTRSLSAESLSFVSNDSVVPYAGEDYESVLVNYYQALNYLVLGDYEGALVECLRLDEKLNWFADRFEGRDRFKESPFLRLLTGLIYEAAGDANNAFIAYRKSLEAYHDDHQEGGLEAPAVLWGRLLVAAWRTGFFEEYDKYREAARLAGIETDEAGTVIAVLVDRGQAPVKKEVYVLVPTEQGFPVKLAVPEFVSRHCATGPVVVSVDGDDWVSAERVEDVDALARRSLADKQALVLTKAAARAVSKQLLARQAEKEYGPLAGLTAQVAALLTERADLRSWLLLPAEIQLAVVPAEPGWHTVTVRFGDRETAHAVKAVAGSVGFVAAREF